MRKIDFDYCASSYLSLRTIEKNYKFFKGDKVLKKHFPRWQRKNVHNSSELEEQLRKQTMKACSKGKCALCLSGGIDSAILAKFMPKGSLAYTFKCVVPGIKVTDESEQAAKYAKECGLKQKVIEVYWEDFEKFLPVLMKHKGAPIHSIEVQIYKAALEAKKDGIDTLIFGESADVNYGGMSNILSRDWTFDEFVERYSYVNPETVLINPKFDKEPFRRYLNKDGTEKVHDFLRNVFYQESMNSYLNACTVAGVKFFSPFGRTYMAVPLDIERVRRGENKYFVREVFNRLYPNLEAPAKIPMPRPMNEWFQNYKGPKSNIFKKIDYSKLTGDQKWLIYCLDTFTILRRENHDKKFNG